MRLTTGRKSKCNSNTKMTENKPGCYKYGKYKVVSKKIFFILFAVLSCCMKELCKIYNYIVIITKKVGGFQDCFRRYEKPLSVLARKMGNKNPPFPKMDKGGFVFQAKNSVISLIFPLSLRLRSGKTRRVLSA